MNNGFFDFTTPETQGLNMREFASPPAVQNIAPGNENYGPPDPGALGAAYETIKNPLAKMPKWGYFVPGFAQGYAEGQVRKASAEIEQQKMQLSAYYNNILAQQRAQEYAQNADKAAMEKIKFADESLPNSYLDYTNTPYLKYGLSTGAINQKDLSSADQTALDDEMRLMTNKQIREFIAEKKKSGIAVNEDAMKHLNTIGATISDNYRGHPTIKAEAMKQAFNGNMQGVTDLIDAGLLTPIDKAKAESPYEMMAKQTENDIAAGNTTLDAAYPYLKQEYKWEHPDAAGTGTTPTAAQKNFDFYRSLSPNEQQIWDAVNNTGTIPSREGYIASVMKDSFNEKSIEQINADYDTMITIAKKAKGQMPTPNFGGDSSRQESSRKIPFFNRSGGTKRGLVEDGKGGFTWNP